MGGQVAAGICGHHGPPSASALTRDHADLRTHLERNGTPIGGDDRLIGGHALPGERILMTGKTREFGRIPGLTVESWLRP